MLTLYNTISADGFIARKDGSEDFIPDDLWPDILNLYKQYGEIIMGRKTFEVLQGYPKELLEPFENMEIERIVVSSDPSFKAKPEYSVVHSPEEAARLAPNALVSSGPTLNNYLIKKHLVKKIILYKVPTAIGIGIKPFEIDLTALIPVENVAQVEGVKVVEYEVAT